MSARFLIVTAAFGEGHNSAAGNLALALEESGATTRVLDPCILATPHTTRLICKGYRLVTTHLPALWHRIYRSTGQIDFTRQRFPLMRKPETLLIELVRDFAPDAVITTYPLYPYFLDRTFASTPDAPQVFTVVTDSIQINSAWLKAPSAYWLVTDPYTRDSMLDQGLAPDRVVDTGFCVHPSFSRTPHLDAEAATDPFKVLYFPTPKRPHVRRISKAILKPHPQAHLTIVLGKNVRTLHQKAREIRDRFPGRVTIRGWTKKVPQLLANHHLVLGKAGGATVHEAIAARCPMLVHHIVPGQEEGNLQLLERIGGGTRAETPEEISAKLTDLLADHAAGWRRMKRALAQHGRSNGALAAARFIIEKTTR